MTSSLAPGLARKVKKILELKTESPDLVGSLSTLSTFYEDNTPTARRALRSTIEQRGVDVNSSFLTAAESVIHALDQLESHLASLSGSCTTISSALSTASSATKPLLNETERLSAELGAVQRKSGLVEEFLNHYQLTQTEVDALQGEEVGEAFFRALARVQQIHEACRGLLRTSPGHQRAGLEMMDTMAGHMETAYERLCRWVQSECRSFSDYDALEVNPALQQAVRALRERPVLFKYCAEEVVTARHNALFQRFIAALTRGGPGGMPRPIEIHAHDPKRYINDMLAWVHQALAGEQELLGALFGNGEKHDSHAQHEHDGEDSLSTTSLLDRVFESLARPLKVRIEQVLLTSPPVLTCFQLFQLLSFYHTLVTSSMHDTCTLATTLRVCRDMAQRVFFEQLKAKGDKMLRNPPAPPADLSPPPQVFEQLHQLSEIITAHESALQASTIGTAQDDSMKAVIAACIDPLLELIERCAEALTPDAPSRVDEVSRLDPNAVHIFLINCLSVLHGCLSVQVCAADRAQQVAGMMSGHVSALVGREVGRLLSQSFLLEIVERLRLYVTIDPTARMTGQPSHDPALQLPAIAEAMRLFVAVVSKPDALPEFTKIQVARTRSDAVGRVAASLAEAYELVYGAVEDSDNGYSEQGGVGAIRHTPAQVRTILGVL